MKRRVPRYLLGFGFALLLVHIGEMIALLYAGSSFVSEGRYLVGFLSSVVATVGLIYGAHWLPRSELSPDRYPRVAEWGAGVLGITLLFNGTLMLTMRIESMAMLVSWIRWAVAIGAGLGLLIGILEGRAIARAIVAERATIRSERLEQQRDRLDYLNSTLRHEVLNTAMIIQGYATRLDEEESLSEEGEQWVTTIRDEADEMASVIEDVRVLLQTTASDHDLKRMDLGTVLTEEIRKLEHRWDGIEVSASVPGGVHVRGDEMLPRVFGNLLSNAVEHNDSPTPRIDVAVEEGTETVRVRIEDNGPGVPDGEVDSLFARDEEGSSTHGIGLYLVASLVDRYGGSVELTETGPDGSVFTVELPRATDWEKAASADTTSREITP